MRWALRVESGQTVLDTPAPSPNESDGTLRELINRYSEEVLPYKKGKDSEKYRIQGFLNHRISNLPIHDVTRGDMLKYRNERLKLVKPATVKREFNLLRYIFSLAISEWEYAIENPATGIRLPNADEARDRRFYEGEEVSLVASAHEYGGPVKDIIIIALETAMRRSEIVFLTKDQIDLHNRTAHLPDTKNGHARNVPLSSRAVATLKPYLALENNRLFDIRCDSITRAFRKICDRAKIDNLRFHDIRHEATSRFFELGLNLMEVAAITGHKDLSMLQRYTHLRASDLAKKLP